MAQVRSVSDSARKFVARAQGASEDYKAGVAGAGGRWKAGAGSAHEAWADGVSGAVANRSFEKGVNKGGTEAKYQNNATKLGPSRFREGVANAEGAYTAGVQPYNAAMTGFVRSIRGSRRSGNNMKRVEEQITLMRATKAAQLG